MTLKVFMLMKERLRAEAENAQAEIFKDDLT